MWMCADIGYKHKTPRFKIGKVYIGSSEPFEVIVVSASNVKIALDIAASYLRPNYLQTLKVIGQLNERTN